MGFYSDTSFRRRVISLVGGFMLHLVIGTLYTFGNFVIYLASYLRAQGADITLTELEAIFPIQVASSTVFNMIGTYSTLHTNQYLTTSIGASLIVLSVFITSFLTNPYLVILIYGLGFGIGVGVTYTTPLMISWSHFPHHRSQVSGIIIAGFGFATAIFNVIGTYLINPDNKKPDIEYENKKYFSNEVTDNVPGALRTLALCYLALSIIGISLLGKLVKPDKDDDENDENYDECPNLKTGLKSKQFWVLFVLGILFNTPGLYTLMAYKNFGINRINDDKFLSFTGSIGLLFNGCFRYIWAHIMGKTSFMFTMTMMASIMFLLVASFYYIAEVKILFFLWFCGICACEGGMFTLFPSVIVKCFGKIAGAKLYGLYFYSIGVSSLAGYALQNYLLDDFGYEPIFLTMSGLLFAGIIILRFLFKERNPWKVSKDYVEMGVAN